MAQKFKKGDIVKVTYVHRTGQLEIYKAVILYIWKKKVLEVQSVHYGFRCGVPVYVLDKQCEKLPKRKKVKNGE